MAEKQTAGRDRRHAPESGEEDAMLRDKPNRTGRGRRWNQDRREQVTDASAHAWVEIFLEDYGWTPIEVTPDAQGQISVLCPGLDGAALRDPAEGRRKVFSLY